MNAVDQIANTILYEGYNLYPYRPSSIKNRQRWNFGLVYPQSYAAVADGTGASAMQTECLLLGGPLTQVQVRVRFLHAANPRTEETACPVGAPWQEAVEREVKFEFNLAGGASQEFCFDAAPDSSCACESIRGAVEVSCRAIQTGAHLITLRISNLTELEEKKRHPHEAVIPQTFLSTHTILRVSGGEFVSLLEPPDDLRAAASDCRNIGTWPVLAGERGQFQHVLSSPIILYDYPEVAPESPGDLFDGAEIDEILTLRIMTMTDEEKAEMRGTDDRTRRMLERTEQLPPEHLAKLHGVLRELRPADRL